jgi:ribosomal protein S1
VSRVADFGAFISLDPGIEALLHVSQFSDPPPEDPMVVVREGQRLMMRVISIEADKQRLGLSLKEVTEEENRRWVEQQSAESVENEAVEAVEATETGEIAQAETGQDASDPVQSLEQIGEVEVDTAGAAG